jgi:protein TonB
MPPALSITLLFNVTGPAMTHSRFFNLSIFILLSIGVHAALLSSNWSSRSVDVLSHTNTINLSLTPAIKRNPPTSSTIPANEKKLDLSVRNRDSGASRKTVISNRTVLTRRKKATRKVAIKSNKMPAGATDKKIPPKTVQRMETITTKLQQEAVTNNARSTSNRQVQQRITRELHTRITFFHYYPRLAIRNQWQGQVNLGLRVEANGELSNIHIVRSSGYRILDNAAMNSIQKVAAIPEAEPWLRGRHVELVLPVIYKLVDG